MSILLEMVNPYVPPLLARHFVDDPTPPRAPGAESFPAAVLFADISGFTPLTQQLARRGPAGAEELSRLLNDYFDRLVDILTAHGGQVVAFAGDATIVLWPGIDSDEDLSRLTLRAAQCGLELMSTLNGYRVVPDVVLSLKAGIGAGQVWAATLGGLQDRWSFLVAGEPLDQIAIAEPLARQGEVLLSPAAWAQIQEHCTGQPRAQDCVRLDTVNDPLPLRALALVPLPPQAAAALRTFVPRTATERIDAGQAGWLADLRRVTMLFVNVKGLDYGAAGTLEQVQAATQAIQEIVYRYQGSLNQLVVDDKGTIAVAAWGLPGHTHEDDSARAVQGGLDLQVRLRALGLGSTAGVATGRAFCGERGSRQRREYTVIGETANRANRLMAVGAPDDLLCDQATQQNASQWLAFDPMPLLIFKGTPLRPPIFRAREKLPTLRLTKTQKMVGRQAEKKMLAEQLAGLQALEDEDDQVRVVILEGEPGIGKSCLVGELQHLARQLGIRALVGAGDAVEQATAYFAWRPVFAGLFGLDLLASAAEGLEERILAQLQSEPDMARVAPLLNAVLPLNLPDNDLTAEMSGDVRASNTSDLLLRLLTALPWQSQAPESLLIVLEDAQWLDSASWALAYRVSHDLAGVLLVISTRPLSEPLPADYVKLVQDLRTSTMHISSLSRQDTAELIRARLGAPAIADDVVSFVHNRSDGNPFFSEEMAYALRDASLITVDEGLCRFVVDIGDLGTLLPGTIEEVISARIDQLPPQHQMTLKVASVIGRLFAFRTLRDVHPIDADRPNLVEHVANLERLDLTHLQAPEPDLTYIFKHVITQQVTYNLMLFAQRRQLHRAVAEWYERVHAGDLSTHYPLLAYHWERAIGDGEGPAAAAKALEYLEKAGDQALHNFANEEAVRFFERALALDTEAGAGIDELRRAHWELQLGVAHANLRRYAEGWAHLVGSLALLGQPVPATTVGLVPGLLGQVLRQVLHRAWPARYVGRLARRQETLQAAFRAYEKLTEVFFFLGQATSSMYVAFRALNEAEAAGPSPEMARGYASMGALVGFIPLHSTAEAYLDRALAAAQTFDNLATRGYVALAAGFYYAGVGRWAKAMELFDQILVIAQRLGDQRRWGDAMGNLAPIHYYRGEFASGAGVAAALDTAAHVPLNRAEGLQWQAKCLFCLGRFDEASTCLDRLQAVLDQSGEAMDRSMKIGVNGLLATIYLRQGAHERAFQLAGQAADLAAKAMPSSYGILSGYANPAEVYLALWEAGYPQPGLEGLARRACKLARGFARVFAIGRPRALLWDGLYAWLSGKPDRAQAAWQQSLAAAARLQMPYDEGLALYEIGRHLPAGDPARQEHLARACAIFERLGTAYDLGRVQEALAAAETR